MTGLDKAKKNFGFGCMRLPLKEDKVAYDEFTRMVDLYMAEGFNYFDTARVYLGGQIQLNTWILTTRQCSRVCAMRFAAAMASR